MFTVTESRIHLKNGRKTIILLRFRWETLRQKGRQFVFEDGENKKTFFLLNVWNNMWDVMRPLEDISWWAHFQTHNAGKEVSLKKKEEDEKGKLCPIILHRTES